MSRPSILIKAGRVDLVMDDGAVLVFSDPYGLAHDPEGRDLPRCTLFLAPVSVTGERVELQGDAAAYFGTDYDARRARITIPKGRWRANGRAREIIYFRPGKYEDDWTHTFAAPVPLERLGRAYRLSLPRDCELSWRGIVRP